MRPFELLCPPENCSLPNDEATAAACINYLTIKSLPHVIRCHKQAYFSSPDGLLPVSNVSGNLVSGYMSLVFTIKSLSEKEVVDLDTKLLEVKNAHHIFFFWVADVFRNLTLYLTWADPGGERHTRNYFDSIYPWPLGLYYFYRQKNLVMKFLNSVNWNLTDIGEVLRRFEDACKHISCMLTEGPYIFNRKKVGKVDCIVAAYFNTFSTNAKYFALLFPIISKYPALSKLATSVRPLP